MDKMSGLAKILEEYNSASVEFGAFHSAHEGIAVIKEEYDELWDEVKKKNRSIKKMRKEATQIGAMALRFLVDIGGS